MPEYIERETAKKILADDYAYAAAKLLDIVPTADVAEVKHGKWIKDRNCYTCSKCGFYYFANNSKPKYCHYCGQALDWDG